MPMDWRSSHSAHCCRSCGSSDAAGGERWRLRLKYRRGRSSPLSSSLATPSFVLASSYVRTRHRPTVVLATFPEHVRVLGAGEGKVHGDRTRQSIQNSYRERDFRDSKGYSGTDTPKSRWRRARQARQERIVLRSWV